MKNTNTPTPIRIAFSVREWFDDALVLYTLDGRA